MSVFDLATQVTTVANALTAFLSQVRATLTALAPFRAASLPLTDYENLRLDIRLTILDTQGRKAILERRQRVRFQVPDSGIVRDLLWGEGNQLARYASRGATRLGLRREGSRQALMLSLPHRPAQDERATIRSRRVITDGLLQRSEYCEAAIERQTQDISVTVLFPRGRAPHDAQLVASGGATFSKSVPVHHDARGRASLKWQRRTPQLDTIYSLRWSW